LEGSADFLKVLDALKEGTMSIQNITDSTGMTSREIKDILAYYLKSPLKSFWRLEFYNEMGESMIDLEGEGDTGILKSKIKPETRVSLWCSMDDVNNSMFLTGDERWALYDLLKECGSEFIEDVKNDILKEYHDEIHEKYRNVSERRIIKGYRDIFNFKDGLLLKIYGAVQRKCCINIKLKDGITLKNILPIKVFLDDDLDRWNLEYLNRGDTEEIWMKRILDVEVLPPSIYSYQEVASGRDGKKVMTQVKIRVYDEKNSRDRAVDFLSPKYIIEEKTEYGFSDITAKVINIEAFKKWVMEMIPQVIIIEPLELRNEFTEMADEWVKNYMAGI
jgi:hypothetical protein